MLQPTLQLMLWQTLLEGDFNMVMTTSASFTAMLSTHEGVRAAETCPWSILRLQEDQEQ
jgi:hypothetical protein